jgi:hypothetical protein
MDAVGNVIDWNLRFREVGPEALPHLLRDLGVPFTHPVPAAGQTQRKSRHIESGSRLFRVDPHLYERVAIKAQGWPVGIKILSDQLEGKHIVTRRYRGVGGKDGGSDDFLASGGKILPV